MKRRFIKKISVFILSLTMLTGIFSVNVWADTGSDYNTALAEFKNASALLNEKETAYQTVLENEKTAWKNLSASYDIDKEEIEISDENINKLNQEIADAQNRLKELPSEIEQAQKEYDAVYEKYADGMFSFLPWVAEKYPQYKEDAEKALEILEYGAEQGWLKRGDLKDGPSIYNMKRSIEYFHEFIRLKNYFKDDPTIPRYVYDGKSYMTINENMDKTSFVLTALAFNNAGHSYFVEFNHNHEYIMDNHIAGENLAQTAPYKEGGYYDGYVISAQSSDYLKGSMNGYSGTKLYKNWFNKYILSQYPDFRKDWPSLIGYQCAADAYYLWFLEEKWIYDDIKDGNLAQGTTGHYTNVLGFSHTGIGIIGSNIVQDGGFIDATPPSMSIYTYEQLLDEYFYSLGFVEATDKLNGLKAEQSSLTDLIPKNEAVIEYLRIALERQSAEEALEQAQAAYNEAKQKYTQYELTTPLMPSSFRALNTKKNITLTWDKAIASGVRYDIYRKTADTEWEKIKTTSLNKFKDTAAEAGTSYQYSIVAYNKNGGNELGDTAINATRLEAPAIESAYRFSFKYRKLMNGSAVSWAKVPGASSYAVYMSRDRKDWTLAAETEKTYIAPDKNQEVNSRYYYKVYAKAADGSLSPASNTCKFTRPAELPEKITAFNAGGEKLSWSTNIAGLISLPTTDEAVTLKWTKSKGAAKYDIYEASSYSGSFTKLATVKKCRYTLSSAHKMNNYFVIPHGMPASYE